MISHRKVISALFIMIFFLIQYYYIFSVANPSAFVISILSVFSLLISVFILMFNGIKSSSIIYFFIISYSVFIYGRFLSYILNYLFFNEYNNDVYSLFQVTWMTSFTPTIDQIRELFLIVNGFLLFFIIGFLIIYRKKENSNNLTCNVNIKIIKIIFFILLTLSLVGLINSIFTTLTSGYHALYSGQGVQSDASSGMLSGITKIMFSVSFSYIVLYEKKYMKYLLIFALYSIVSGLTGSRGGLVVNLLLLIYLYIWKKNINPNFLKIGVSLFIVFITMIVVLGFSARGGGNSEQITASYLFDFLYSQGISLSVVGFSIYGINDYPLQTILQSFIPLFFRFYKLFDPNVLAYTSSITSYLSYTANPAMFLSGAGLGSSIVSEFYIIIGKQLMFFLGLAFLGGLLLGFVELRAKTSAKYFIFLISIIPILLFSPRNGLNVLFISAVYIFMVIHIYNLLLKKKIVK